jgi:Transmembrane domain of unknown function (DUF3566)
MADHRRREESTPLVPPRSLGGRRESGEREEARWSGQTRTQDGRTQDHRAQQTRPPQSQSQQSQQSQWGRTQEQPAHSNARDSHLDSSDEDTQRMQPLAAAAAAVAAVKERAMGPSPRPEGVSRQEDQVRAASAARPGRTRRARLRLVRVDPWSVMKTAFLLSIAFGIMCVVAVFIIWSVLTAANVFGSINESMTSLLDNSFAIEDYIGMDRVLSFTMLVAVLNVVLLTAIATLGAFLYNLAASLLGGLEVTLAEDDHH